jgi:hypothetical protein
MVIRTSDEEETVTPPAAAPEVVEKAPVVDPTQPRQWAAVAQEIRELREKGATVPDICEQLQVSYVLVNQCVLQSYKIAVDSAQVFERQERMRLGLD